MRHAFLILAHNEFAILQLLLNCIDHPLHDIFIHVDQKVAEMPSLHCEHAGLHLLQHRVDVRWGDISMLKAEFLLFEEARLTADYSYYHVVSGLHLPLCSVSAFHQFFHTYNGLSVMQRMEGSAYEFDMKFRYYHVFTGSINAKHTWVDRLGNLAWRIGMKLQRTFNVKRTIEGEYTKSSQWLSLTREAVDLILLRKALILKKYRFTLCPDEFFIPTELENSNLKGKIRYDKHYLKYDFNSGSSPKTYTIEDFGELVASNCLFARKFSEKHMDVALLIAKKVKQND